MESAVLNQWEIIPDWLELSSGTVEERATYCALGIKINDRWLTRGHDIFTDTVKNAPVLSAYHAAEWFAGNWWRLRWEPRGTPEWPFSHNLAAIGQGYVWPDLAFASEGHRIHLSVKKTPKPASNSYTYLTEFAGYVDASQFERVLEDFINQVVARLDAHGIHDSSLHALWRDVVAERSDPALSATRTREALMGLEPGQLDNSGL